METKNNKSQNPKVFSVLLIVLGAVILLSCLLLPYATATKEQRENLERVPNFVVYEELDMKSKDLIDISMVEYALVYGNMGKQLFGDETIGVIYVTIVALIGGFSLLALVFGLLKKAIPTMIFAILSCAVFYIQNLDYTDRGVIPSRVYDWGIVYYLFPIATLVVIVGAVMLIVEKRKTKKYASILRDNTITDVVTEEIR